MLCGAGAVDRVADGADLAAPVIAWVACLYVVRTVLNPSTGFRGLSVDCDINLAVPDSTQPRWYGPGTAISIGGLRLESPCVYCIERRIGSNPTDPSTIDRSLPIRRAPGFLSDMGYWPSYSRIEPEHRHLFLQWLASGRKEIPALEGALFIFYYGLERRLLLEGRDFGTVITEVVRLLKLDFRRRGTAEGRSFRHYACELLWFMVAYRPERFNPGSFTTIAKLADGWTDDWTASALRWFDAHNRAVPAGFARLFTQADGRAEGRALATKAGASFNTLFAKRFAAQFPSGIITHRLERDRVFEYKPATNTLAVAKFVKGAVVIDDRDQCALVALWNGCVQDLRATVRLRSGRDGAAMTIREWSALPTELRADTQHPIATSVGALSSQAAPLDRGDAIFQVKTGALAALIGIPQRQTLTRSQSAQLAETLADAGYAIEPDVRVIGRALAWEDRVSVFGFEHATDERCDGFRMAACVLQFGIAVALADGLAQDEELERLRAHLDSAFQLFPIDRRRLKALQYAWVRGGCELPQVDKRVAELLTSEQRRSLGRVLVALAATNGSIDRGELTVLRRIFRALELAPETLEEAITDVLPTSDSGLETVESGREATVGEELPPLAAVTLDRRAISVLMEETRAVGAALAAAMMDSESSNDERPQVPQSSQPVPSHPTSDDAPSALGMSVHRFFVALRARPNWTRAAAAELARTHGLMLSGAIDSINEWSMDRDGEMAIEDHGETLLIVLPRS